MRIGAVLLLLLLISSTAMYAQEVLIRGSIKSENQIPLLGATIQIDSSRGVVTDENGRFNIVSAATNGETLLKVKMLGYKDLDTLVKLRKERIFVELTLKQDAYVLPTAEIPSSQFNLFDGNNWNILDHAVLKGKHYVLGYQRNKRSLFIFSATGNLLIQEALQQKYNKIHLSCQKQLHLIGEETYSKVKYEYGSLEIAPYDGELYHNLIKKCILMNRGKYVFKELSDHNKSAKYYDYPEPGKTRLIKEIVDNKARKASNSYYRQIIGAYYSTVENPDSTNITYGIQQDNIIALGEWSGDLKELIITNELQSLVSYYLNVVSQEINVYEFSTNDTMRVFDLNNRALHIIDTRKPKSMKIALDPIAFEKNIQVIEDASNGNLYVVNKDYKVFKLSIANDEVKQSFSCQLSSNDLILRRFQIYDGELFYITREAGRPVSKMHRVELSR